MAGCAGLAWLLLGPRPSTGSGQALRGDDVRGLGGDLEAVEGGAVHLKSNHEGAGGGDSGGFAPGDGGVEVVAGEGGGLGEGVSGEGGEGFVLEFDSDGATLLWFWR